MAAGTIRIPEWFPQLLKFNMFRFRAPKRVVLMEMVETHMDKTALLLRFKTHHSGTHVADSIRTPVCFPRLLKFNIFRFRAHKGPIPMVMILDPRGSYKSQNHLGEGSYKTGHVPSYHGEGLPATV